MVVTTNLLKWSLFMRLSFMLCFFVAVFSVHSGVFAQSIVRVQEMDFGEAVVKRNDAQYSMMVTSAGNLSADSNFIHVAPIAEGVYRLTGAAANRPITVNITVDQQMITAGQQMIIDNFDIDAPTQTDASGEALIRVGARVRTNGNGVNYIGDADYLALMTLSITVL